jgi:hypothetical protein
MADAAKTPEEIEDVLASIRRLVSEEPSGQAKAEPTPEQQHSEPATIERLVLTPSLRVSDPVESETPFADDSRQEHDDASNVFEDGDAADVQPGPAVDIDHRPEDNPEAALELADDAFRDIEGAPDSALLEILFLDGASDDGLISGDGQLDRGDWQPEDRLAEYDAVGQTSDEDVTEQTAEVVELDGALKDLAAEVEDLRSEEAEHTDAFELPDIHTDAGETSSDEIAEVDVSDDVAEGEAASEADIADLIRLDGAALETAEFESDTGDDNWPEDNAEAALLSLVARRPATPEAAAPGGDATINETEQDSFAPDAEDAADPADEPLSERKDVLARAVEVVASADTPAESDETAEAETETAGSADEQDASAQAAPSQADVPSTPVFSRRHRAAAAAAAAAADAATPQPDTPETAPDGTTDSVDDETSLWAPFENVDDVLDEEALREIIADVVREELQGVLGQRITRNVRKMVRREIRLALAAEDLE